MDGRSPNIGNREILRRSGFRIDARDLVRIAEVRNPNEAVLVRSSAEGHAARTGHVVFHVHDIERVLADRS